VKVRPDQRDLAEHIPMVEFALNSAISSSSGFAPFELNYGYSPSINPGMIPKPSTVPGVKHFVTRALQNLADAHDAIIESRVHQTHQANCRRHEDNTFAVGDLIYVSSTDLSLPKGHAVKLLPKYIGPFKVIDAQSSTSNYRVELPTQLQARNLHDRFHWSKLHPYQANDDVLFPHREVHRFYDFGTPDDQEWLVEEILTHEWEGNQLYFQIHWNLGDTTWEPLEMCEALQALDEYLHLQGVGDIMGLPRRNVAKATRNERPHRTIRRTPQRK
jgi:hypothetical protein